MAKLTLFIALFACVLVASTMAAPAVTVAEALEFAQRFKTVLAKVPAENRTELTAIFKEINDRLSQNKEPISREDVEKIVAFLKVKVPALLQNAQQ